MKSEIAEIQANVLFIRKFIENDEVCLQCMKAMLIAGCAFALGFGMGMIIPLPETKSYLKRAKAWAKKMISKLED